MQVDWGVFKLNGKRVSLYLSTLGWSRYAYGVFVDPKTFEIDMAATEEARTARRVTAQTAAE